jgi:hypothetical protein
MLGAVHASQVGGAGRHKVGFGSVFVVDFNRFLAGPWERDRVASFVREVVVRVFSLGNGVVEGLCAVDGFLMGRVSGADASLSLSLSLAGPASSR